MAHRLETMGKRLINLREEGGDERREERWNYQSGITLIGIFCVYLNPVNEFRDSSIDSR